MNSILLTLHCNKCAKPIYHVYIIYIIYNSVRCNEANTSNTCYIRDTSKFKIIYNVSNITEHYGVVLFVSRISHLNFFFCNYILFNHF